MLATDSVSSWFDPALRDLWQLRIIRTGRGWTQLCDVISGVRARKNPLNVLETCQHG